MVKRIATCDHSWPFGHTGLLGWRCMWKWSDSQRSYWLTGQMWILFSSTELMRRVKAHFDHMKCYGGELQVRLAFRPFVFGGIKGTGQMVDERSGRPDLVYCGSHVWSGLRPIASQSGHTIITEQAQANWEQFTYSWIRDRGQDPFVAIGRPQWSHLWAVRDQNQQDYQDA